MRGAGMERGGKGRETEGKIIIQTYVVSLILAILWLAPEGKEEGKYEGERGRKKGERRGDEVREGGQVGRRKGM